MKDFLIGSGIFIIVLALACLKAKLHQQHGDSWVPIAKAKIQSLFGNEEK